MNGNPIWPTLFVKTVFCFKLKSKKNVTETVVKGTVLVLVPQDRAAPDHLTIDNTR